MKNVLGGLFQTQENANLAYEALQKAGFKEEEINTYVHKPRKSTARATDIRVQDIAKNAFIGGLIVGAIGAFLGFLVGTGIIPLPGLEPGLVELNTLFLLMSVIWGLVTGALTGAILGAASKLLRSREKAEVMTRQIEKRGVLVTVSVNGIESERKAKRVMEEHEAIEIGNPSEKWDLEAWFSPNETHPSLVNTK